MQNVADHEADLTAYALTKLNRLKGVRVFGDPNPDNAHQRLGVIPILTEEVSHFLASAILGYEFGIGVRSGCFCAHPYILHLLGLSEAEAHEVRRLMISGDKRDMPGMIRCSFGLYNTREEVDRFIDALDCILCNEYKGRYVQTRATGEYKPEGWSLDTAKYFSFLPD
jgi:selenocysteine lyase/cysteine desulfurase